MAHKVIVPPKKNYIPQFLKQRDINSYLRPSVSQLLDVFSFTVHLSEHTTGDVYYLRPSVCEFLEVFSFIVHLSEQSTGEVYFIFEPVCSQLLEVKV